MESNLSGIRLDLDPELSDEQRAFRAQKAAEAIRQMRLFEVQPRLKLCDPPEHGWERDNVVELFPDTPPEAA